MLEGSVNRPCKLLRIGIARFMFICSQHMLRQLLSRSFASLDGLDLHCGNLLLLMNENLSTLLFHLLSCVLSTVHSLNASCGCFLFMREFSGLCCLFLTLCLSCMVPTMYCLNASCGCFLFMRKFSGLCCLFLTLCLSCMVPTMYCLNASCG